MGCRYGTELSGSFWGQSLLLPGQSQLGEGHTRNESGPSSILQSTNPSDREEEEGNVNLRETTQPQHWAVDPKEGGGIDNTTMCVSLFSLPNTQAGIHAACEKGVQCVQCACVCACVGQLVKVMGDETFFRGENRARSWVEIQ